MSNNDNTTKTVRSQSQEFKENIPNDKDDDEIGCFRRNEWIKCYGQ